MSAFAVERLDRTRCGRPKLRRTDDVLDYWIERVALIAPEGESFSYSSMICRSDRLFHYGDHFELARIIRDKRGRARLVLLNGDTYGGSGGWGPSTSSRQSDVRRAAAGTGVESLVVPFSALEGAGIDLDTIVPVHVRSDRHTSEEHSSRTRPAKLATMPDPSGATTPETYWHYDNGRHVEREREIPVRVPNPNRTRPFSATHGWCEDGAECDGDGVWRWTVRRHWLGDSLFRARTVEMRTRKPTPEELADERVYQAWEAESNRLSNFQARLAREGHRRHNERVDYGANFRLQFAVEGIWGARQRHDATRPPRPQMRNGRVPIRVTRWATFLSSFDYQESRPLYFLCELPHGARPGTVDEAIEALKPPEVVAALARGLKVVRQGDLFAIPTKLTTRQIRAMRGRRGITKRLRVLGTNHSVTEGIVLTGGAVLGRGIMRHEPEAWRPPDHASQRLGDAWHLLVRNTVPRSR